MSYNCTKIYFKNMKLLNSKNFMKKYNLQNDTRKESELQRNYNYKNTLEILKDI